MLFSGKQTSVRCRKRKIGFVSGVSDVVGVCDVVRGPSLHLISRRHGTPQHQNELSSPLNVWDSV